MEFSTFEVLDKFKGMTRHFLYYLEQVDFIHPSKIRRGKVDRRLYSEEDIKKIGLIWEYYQRGFTLKEAYRRAEEMLVDGESPAQVRLKEALEEANTAGMEISGMNMDTLIGLFCSNDDVLTDDIARIIKNIANKEKRKRGKRS